MRRIVPLAIAFILGCVVTHNPKPLIPPAHAQQSAQTLTCNVVGPCSQYLVQVNSGRGFGRFQLFQLATPIDQTQLTNIGAGLSVSVQASEPDPRGAQTFTLAVSEP